MVKRLLLALALCGGSAAHAQAPQTRLVRCGAESCLLVRGQRANDQAAVAINGQTLAVQGGRHWRVTVPMAQVRALAQPGARSITVMADGAEQEASLPIGLLGHTIDLAMLVVRAR